LFLKPAFFASFRFFEKVTFPFISDIRFDKEARVNLKGTVMSPWLLYFPKRFFPMLDPESYSFFIPNGDCGMQSYRYYPVDDIGYMLNTLHYLASDIEVNPLYKSTTKDEDTTGNIEGDRRGYNRIDQVPGLASGGACAPAN